MSELTNIFPSVLLGVMIILTLLLLPLLSDDHGRRVEERQRTDEIRVKQGG
jgi:hypothetical protein